MLAAGGNIKRKVRLAGNPLDSIKFPDVFKVGIVQEAAIERVIGLNF